MRTAIHSRAHVPTACAKSASHQRKLTARTRSGRLTQAATANIRQHPREFNIPRTRRDAIVADGRVWDTATAVIGIIIAVTFGGMFLYAGWVM